jgi:hypothetical protein
MFSAVFAKFAELNFSLNQFFVFAGIVVGSVAVFATKSY